MSVTHFTTSLAWWVWPMAWFLCWLGVSRRRSASIIAHGIRIRIAHPVSR